MNMLEWVESGGAVKTANNLTVSAYLSDDDQYPIAGRVAGRPEFECQWDCDGRPWRLPTTHGLQLLAIEPVTTYRVVTNAELSERIA